MSDTRSALGSVETTVRDFWATRPVRPATGGKLGGVAAAIGNRYGVDPVLLRVAFVVAAFYGGSGVLLYLLGWMFFPREERDGSGQVTTRTTSTPVLVVLAVLLIPALYALRNLPGLVGAVVGCVALYLLHRNRAERGPGGSGPGGTTGPAGPDPTPPAPGGGASGGGASGDADSGGAASADTASGAAASGGTDSVDAASGGAGSGGAASREADSGDAAAGDTAAEARPDAAAPAGPGGARTEPISTGTARVDAAADDASGEGAPEPHGTRTGSPRPDAQEVGAEEASAREQGGPEPASPEPRERDSDSPGAGSAEHGGPGAGGAAPGAGEPEVTAADAPGTSAAGAGTGEADTDRFTAQQPPDPWTTSPFASGSPEPQPPAEPAPERPRFDRMLTPVTLLLTALAVAGGLYLSSSPAQILAAALGVLGLGMLVGSVLRRGRVLMVLAVPVAALTLLAAGAATYRGPEIPAQPGTADRYVEMSTAAEANRARTIGAGNLTVDLRGMPPQEAAQVDHVRAATGAGGVTVHVPAGWDVTARCTSGAGTVDCLGTERSGAPARETVTESGEDARNGRTITVTARTGTGYAEVVRG